MRDCLVLGSGRSGTSMVAGTLAGAGYFLGDRLYAPRAANPKGFFEDPEINGINEALLAPVLPPTPRLGAGQRWLGALDVGTALSAPDALTNRIRALVARAPFCFKDPRFCYTLPAWRPHLGDAAFVCVFRHPALTVRSIHEELRTAPYLHDVHLTDAQALTAWTRMYEHVLHVHRHRGDWLFLHYEQVLTPAGLDRLGALLDVAPDRSFPDRHLHRPPPEADLPPEALDVYHHLCDLAGYEATAAPDPTRLDRPDVSVLVPVTASTRHHLPAALADLQRQRGVAVEVIVIDRSPASDLPAALAGEAVVIHEPSPAIGRALRAGAARARGRYVAWHDPSCGALPNRLSHQVQYLDEHAEVDVVTCDVVRRRHDDLTERVVVPPGRAGAGWSSTVLARRPALDRLSESPWYPADLAWYREMAGTARTARVAEGLVTIAAERVPAATALDALDAATLRLAERRSNRPR